MPELVRPTTAVRESFLTAMREFATEGRVNDDSILGADLRTRWTQWSTVEGFETYVEKVRAEEHTPPRPDWVPCTTRWYVDGAEYLGRLAIRHRLTPHLVDAGGHIGYDVRPSARRRGHATAMLSAGLAVAGGLGITSALLTCDVDNVASRTIIERAGGVFEDQRGVKLRYWVPTMV